MAIIKNKIQKYTPKKKIRELRTGNCGGQAMLDLLLNTLGPKVSETRRRTLEQGLQCLLQLNHACIEPGVCLDVVEIFCLIPFERVIQ